VSSGFIVDEEKAGGFQFSENIQIFFNALCQSVHKGLSLGDIIDRLLICLPLNYR